MSETFKRLENWGADISEALARVLGDEALLFHLLQQMAAENDMAEILDDIKRMEYASAFKAAHRMKGSAATLSLNPLLKEVSSLVEILRPFYEGSRDGSFPEREKISEAAGRAEEEWEIFCAIMAEFPA